MPVWGPKHETSTTDERRDQLQFFVANGTPSEWSEKKFRDLSGPTKNYKEIRKEFRKNRILSFTASNSRVYKGPENFALKS